MDRICGLPDEFLHHILLRLPGTADAARTSLLSRRWRTVWAHIPELSFQRGNIDAALAAYSAPTVNRLEITVSASPHSPPVSADRISSWLRFASQRLAGELRISMTYFIDELHEVVLPPCERATVIIFKVNCLTLRFRFPAGGEFSALASLAIAYVRLDGRELEGVLSSGCPVLKKLVLNMITLLNGARVISIRSNSLEWLQTTLWDLKLEIVAPELQVFRPLILSEFNISVSTELSEVDWSANPVGYDPRRHCFGVAGCHLQRLSIGMKKASPVPLMKRFDTVHEGIQEYERFLENTKMLSKCDILVLRFKSVRHGFKPIMLHLLRKCAGIRKLVIQCIGLDYLLEDDPCKPWSGCPCGLIENRKTKSARQRALCWIR